MSETTHGKLQIVLQAARAYQAGEDRRHWLVRNRNQLALALFATVLAPSFLWTPTELRWPLSDSFANTLIGASAAVVLGAYLRRRMAVYPGTGTLSVLLPAFASAYGLIIFAFFFLRLEYARFPFASSFGLAIMLFGAFSLIEPRLRRDRFLLLPFGDCRQLLVRPEADWTIAASAHQLPAGITGVVADLHAPMPSDWERLLSRAALVGLPVYHWKQVAESISGTVDIQRMAENNLGSLLPSSAYLRLKRLVDVLLVMVTLPVTLLAAAAAALAILICDGRPILFRQVRVGFHGDRFVMLKFRTMRHGAESGRPFTVENDDRVTRLGRVLRRFRIDELPQIVNILRGEMSWIGPRPESLGLAEWYEREVPFYSYRHIVRPGITGWAQVHQGNVAEVQAATAKLHYDFYYIKYFSPWLDVLVVTKTIPTLMTGFGSR